MTKTVGNQSNRCRSALLMAVYTFLLALGAAVPMAVSFEAGMATEDAEGEIECGGYTQRTDAEVTDEDLAEARPRGRRVQVVPAAAAPSAPVEATCPPNDGVPPSARLRGS